VVAVSTKFFRELISSTQQKERQKKEHTAMSLAPPINRAMTQLDRAFFKRTLSLVEAHFKEPKLVGQFVKQYAREMLKLKKVRNVHRYEDGTRGVILKEEVKSIDELQKLSPESLGFLQTNNVTLKPYELTIGYDFWKTEEILGAILPEQFLDEIPSGFTITGHIAHLNLRDEFKPYGALIGQVILDKNPNIRTVVDKVGSIDTVFRTFSMKVLAGDNDLVVEQRESNCIFQFDFSKVYWNSRLHTEHDRLVSLFQEGELVCDVMAGVGPFSVPAGKKRVFVMSNDLNPDSFYWMKNNLEKNKVLDYVQPLNLNGRTLIKECIKYLKEFSDKRKGAVKYVSKKRKNGEEPVYHELAVPKFINHFVMNLPDSALEFLNEYNGIYSAYPELKEVPSFELPMVHVYCFEKFSPDEPEPSEEELRYRVHKRICKIMDYDLDWKTLQFQLVRKVAPTKPMYRVTFRLPEEVAFRSI
jgi:tRNA (guanine37-N1)-methyltransferase